MLQLHRARIGGERIALGSRINGFVRALKVSAVLAMATPAFLAAQSFTDISAGITGVHHGSTIWGNYDNDGDLDLLAAGETVSPIGEYADIYNNNSGTFSAIGAGLVPIYGSNASSRSAWGDFDNDGKLDLIVTGQSTLTFGGITRLYHNTGSGFAVETITPALPDIGLGSVAWGDYDNDGDLDLFLCGYTSGYRYSTIYRNDGDNGSGGWNFTDVDPFASYPQHERIWSDGAWGDYDNDGDLDLIVCGTSWDGTSRTTLYRNDGGVMVQTSVTNIVNVTMGSVTWGDFDNDGWLDLVVTGTNYDGSNIGHCEIYTNNHNGTFTHSQSLDPVGKSHAAVGDYNNDGKLDLVLTGYHYGWGAPRSYAYLGNGNGTFTIDPNATLEDLYEGQAAFGDYDNDGRLDLLLSGRTSPVNSAKTIVYHNTTGVTPNTLPSTPAGLTVTSSSWNSATVQWSLSSDAQSPTATLHYNLRVEDQTAGTRGHAGAEAVLALPPAYVRLVGPLHEARSVAGQSAVPVLERPARSIDEPARTAVVHSPSPRQKPWKTHATGVGGPVFPQLWRLVWRVRKTLQIGHLSTPDRPRNPH